MKIPRIALNDSVLKKQRLHTLHELSSARGNLDSLFDEETPLETRKKYLAHAIKILDQIHFVLSSERVGKCLVPNYLLITYYEAMYIVENANKNISIIKIYERKRRKHHNEILSFVGESRDSQFDKDLKAYIAKGYFVWQDKSLPYLGEDYAIMMNRLQEKYK